MNLLAFSLALASVADEPLPPIPLEPTLYGASVAGVGDCNLDGSSDIAIGAWWDRSKGGYGSATVFSGKTGDLLHVVRGREKDSLFGLVVAGIGDVDADGTSDFAVSAPLENKRGKAVGIVRIWSGRDGKQLHEFEGSGEGERFGWSIASAGDVDSDGFADIVIGAPGARLKASLTGAARVYSGKTGKLVYEWYGEEDGDIFGWCVDAAGDCDADGKTDIVVCARGGEYVRVFQGRKGKLLFQLDAPVRGERFAFQARGVRDTNQDGADDIVVGVPWAPSEGALVYSGKKAEKLFALARSTKEGEEGWSFGVAVGGAGDIDVDGFDDVIVGDPGFPELLTDLLGGSPPELYGRVRKSAARPGRAYIYDGQRGKLLMTLNGDAPDDFFGVSVDSAGDVNQDGFSDLLVGAGAKAPFQARVINGKDGSTIREHSIR